jgi:hypothetical protein
MHYFITLQTSYMTVAVCTLHKDFGSIVYLYWKWNFKLLLGLKLLFLLLVLVICFLLLIFFLCLVFYRSSQTPDKSKFLQHRLDSKGSYKVNKSERCKSPGASWRRPPLPKSLSGSSFSGNHFMDRDYMQQMQRSVLDQHEETLKRRIRQRQVSHLNYTII